MIRATLEALERLLLPNTCVACERLLPEPAADELFCSVCAARLRPLGPGCERCGHPMPPIGPCRFCERWPAALRRVRSAVWLGDEARELVHHLKYEGLHRLGAAAAEVIAKGIPRPMAPAVLVPMPLGRRRYRERGYNQAECIAAVLAPRWNLAARPELLRRTRDTASQTRLAPEKRWTNVAGAFTARRPPGTAAPTIILLDDILTTGATLAAAAAACAAAGWPVVEAITFARAMPLGVQVQFAGMRA